MCPCMFGKKNLLLLQNLSIWANLFSKILRSPISSLSNSTGMKKEEEQKKISVSQQWSATIHWCPMAIGWQKKKNYPLRSGAVWRQTHSSPLAIGTGCYLQESTLSDRFAWLQLPCSVSSLNWPPCTPLAGLICSWQPLVSPRANLREKAKGLQTKHAKRTLPDNSTSLYLLVLLIVKVWCP